MYSNKKLRTLRVPIVLSKCWTNLFTPQGCIFYSKNHGSGTKSYDSQTRPSRPNYNYGLTGKGKSKRLHLQEFPSLHGEVLFGLHPIYLALKAARRDRLHSLYIDRKFMKPEFRNTAISELLELIQHAEIRVIPSDKSLLDQLAGNRPHQGVCLDADELVVPEWTCETEVTRCPKGLPIWLLLHNIQDPMNLGAILRTAYYLGVDKVITPAFGSCRLSPVVSKASAGAMEVVDLLRLPGGMSETALCEWWQSRGWEVVGTALDNNTDGMSVSAAPKSLYKFSTSKPTMLLLGNEGFGLHPDLVQACDTLLTIPNYEQTHSGLPRISSLNVSVAAGILLHWIKVSSQGMDR